MNKPSKSHLRALVESNTLTKVIGVNDGLSAIVAERAGFDALWISGLAVSTSYGVPDASILTMTEFLHAAKTVRTTSSLPIIADCDTGFGGIANIVRMIQEYESAGIEAICIEDKEYPKRNSFLDKHQLIDPYEFGARIRIAKQTQTTSEFMVFARLESLIANKGMKDAYKRARIYAEAGADAILVHSKKEEPNEIFEFSTQWQQEKMTTPLVVLPTTYPQITAQDLQDRNISVVIYANHLMRAAIASMQTISANILNAGTTGYIEPEIATVKDIFNLVNTKALEELEKDVQAFMSKKTVI